MRKALSTGPKHSKNGVTITVKLSSVYQMPKGRNRAPGTRGPQDIAEPGRNT